MRNPIGVARALLDPDRVEFHVLGDRILQNCEWHYGVRTIWLDDRALPPTPPDLPRWWGYSVGRWMATRSSSNRWPGGEDVG